MILIIIFQLVYFMLPAYVANMLPVLVQGWLDCLAVPVDFNKKIWGQPIFGSHKTIRGFIAGISGAILVAFIQYMLYPLLWDVSFIDYTNWLFFGFLMGAGALGGDLIKSFFKRRIGILPGKPWIVFDQTDFAIGSIALASIIYFPGWLNSMLILLISFVLHVLSSKIAYLLKFRDVKW